MGAQWAKNEVAAAKRRCDLIVYADGGMSLASRSLDFVALGMVYISGGQGTPPTPHFQLATGTCTNKRRPLSFTAFTFTAVNIVSETEPYADVLKQASHGIETGDGPLAVSNAGGALPGGMTAPGNYFAIKVDADRFRIATSLANAYAGVYIDITSTGTGTHTIAPGAGCQRGLDGYFTYEATQAETIVDTSEMSVIIEGAGYARANNGGTYTSVAMVSSAADYGSQAIEGARTRDDLLRLVARTLVAKFSKVGSNYTFRNLADSKDSHTKEVTAAGAIASNVIDPT